MRILEFTRVFVAALEQVGHRGLGPLGAHDIGRLEHPQGLGVGLWQRVALVSVVLLLGLLAGALLAGIPGALAALPIIALPIGRSAVTTWLLLSGTSSVPAWSPALSWAWAGAASASGVAMASSANANAFLVFISAPP